MGSNNESKAWRTMIAPLVTALIALVVAATSWLQGPSKTDNDKLEARVAVLEVQTESLQRNQVDLSSKMDKVIEMLGDVRVSVAEIAAAKGRK